MPCFISDFQFRRAYPKAFVDALIREGYLAAMIPESYGGSGLNLTASAAILEEIHSQGCNAAACHAQMYTMGTVLRHGSEAQKERYLPRIADGTLRLQAFGVTEPTSGTDTLALKTTARREGDEYVINGQKIWTSRVEHSDLMVLLARTTPRDQITSKTDGLSVFLVDLRDKVGNGIDIRPIRTMINHATTEVFFDNLRISADSLIGEEGKGFRYILSGMNSERILIAAECIGDAKWFLNTGATYARERVVFGAPIGANQGIQFPLARAHAHMLAADASWEAAEACMQTHGGFAFAEEYDVERKFREARLYQVAPISTNLILCYIAEQVLGLPKSYGLGRG